jgi:hypothetical protein
MKLMLCAATAASLLLLGACRPAPAPGAAGDGSAAGSGASSASAAAAATGPSPEGTGTAVALANEPEGSAEAREPAPLPDLVALMRDVGYPDARPDDLARYVPVPPGAIGAAGSFAGVGGEVQVALIRYANANYVRPHLTDLEERRRVVPELAEAWAHDTTAVLHVRAADRATAQRVCDAVSARLGW